MKKGVVLKKTIMLFLVVALVLSSMPYGGIVFAKDNSSISETVPNDSTSTEPVIEEEPVEEPGEEIVEEPIGEPADEPVEEPVEEPIGEPADEPVEEPVEELIEEPVEEPAEESTGELIEESMEDSEEDEISILNIEGTLGNVYLITGSEIEIEFDQAVLNNEEAQNIFTVKIDGELVEWEYLSYFDFGSYGERGGVVNIRLKEPLDIGKPRIQRRNTTLFESTQNTKGPAAAERITVEVNDVIKTAEFKPFYEEIQLGHMSQIEAWAATNSGNSSTNNFSGPIGETKYDTLYLVKQLGEGINAMVGRAEYLNIPAVDAGLQAHVVGSDQSVYEIPAYRELYQHGVTDDTYTRTAIEGSIEKPIIVTTADQVMRHDSDVKNEDGTPARPRTDYFDFGEHFLRLYFHFGVAEGSKLFPVGYFDEWDEYRYDVQLEEAFNKAKAEGKWAGTIMEENLESYYVYGAMIHFELIPESEDGSWQYDRFPINTREELHDYDNDLYRVLCGIHGRYNYFAGTPDQAGTFTDDTMKNRHPWFWRSQADNYTVDSNGEAVEREPLKIEHVHIISSDQIEIKFNREISTIAPAARASNWKVYKDGEELRNVSIRGGYAWRTITLQVRGTSLDNGRPYGPGFSGFTQKDIDERKIDAGGWIDNDQKPGEFPLDFGEFVSLEDAIEKWGAGPSGVIQVEYVGDDDVKDWDDNALEKNVKHEAEFLPWMGNAYRSPLTGLYVYADTVVDEETIKAAAHMYDTLLSNNRTVTYPMSTGGEDFPEDPLAVVAPDTGHNNSDRNYVNSLLQNFDPFAPVTYDRVGQRIADAAVRNGGGMQLIGGSHFGHHAAMQPTHRNQIGSTFHVYLYVEGWGGNRFQADEVLVLKDTQLSRYKNENLVFHEGGHGVDSFTRVDSYAPYVRYDTTAAWVTAVAPENGRRWWNQYNTEGAYLRHRDEHVSTGTTFWAGAMRESFLGINDGTWTPVNTREELFRYDPYSFEAFKRLYYNGELGLWYHDDEGNPRVGDPEYKVILEDWELLRDQYEEFKHWTNENYLMAWGSTIPEIARYNPYTGEYNPLINWISWNTPNVWNIGLIEDPAVPTNRFDFKGRDAYYPAEPSPTQSQTHPFFREGGVKKPVRPPEIEALVKPVKCDIVEDSITMPRPVLIQFEIENYDRPITSNNVQTSFELRVDGQLKHFYLHDFEEENGVGIVTLRVEWPLEDDAEIEIKNVDKITVNISGKDEVRLNESLIYCITMEDFKEVNVITLEFEIDNADIVKFENYLKNNVFDVLRAADQNKDIVWTEVDNKLSGKITLVALDENKGVSSKEAMEIIKLYFEPEEVGNVNFSIRDVKIAGVDENGEAYYHQVRMSNSRVDTTIVDRSEHDVNGDGKVDELDLALAVYYYQCKEGDSDWNKAKRADINEDGVVNILDIIEIFTNFTVS